MEDAVATGVVAEPLDMTALETPSPSVAETTHIMVTDPETRRRIAVPKEDAWKYEPADGLNGVHANGAANGVNGIDRPKLAARLTIAQQERQFKIHRVFSVDDRGDDAYSGTFVYGDNLVFYLALDDADREYVTNVAVMIEREQLALGKPPAEDDTLSDAEVLERVSQLIDERLEANTKLSRMRVALNRWILARAWRGSLLTDDWRKLYPDQLAEVAQIITERSAPALQEDEEALLPPR